MKSTKGTRLLTRWAKELDKACPLIDYPRPQLKRDSYICLNGEWDFVFFKGDGLPTEYRKKIVVPFAPESALSGVEFTPCSCESMVYRRFFDLDESFLKKRVLLHFGAVDQLCEVYLNGTLIKKNEGGYVPFTIECTAYLKESQNELIVKAKDALDLIYPYGKQTKNRGGMWYTPVSGIWQTVWLESVPENYIEGLKITQTKSKATIEVFGALGKKTLTLIDSGESFCFTENKIEITPSEIKLWTPESPYLYRFTLETENDRVESYFALREIGVSDFNGVKRLTLNGAPYLFHGLLDQGYFPDGLFTPASYDAYRYDILYAKAAGFNTLRKHIKIEPDIFYYLCDELGMVVFQDMVNNSDYSFFRDTVLPTVGVKRVPDKRLHKNAVSREIFLKTAEKTIELLYNHPSVLYYTIFNEGWGQFDADYVYETLKPLDESRIFDSTSGWFWQSESDVDSHHVYFKKVRVKPHRKMPTVISEFGGYSYRVKNHLFGDKNYGYKTFKTQEELTKSVENLYLDEICPLVKSCISALVYTQISDIEDETNGFLTYDREVSKVDIARLKNIKIALDAALSDGVKKEL